jgi:hypothetical protein
MREITRRRSLVAFLVDANHDNHYHIFSVINHTTLPGEPALSGSIAKPLGMAETPDHQTLSPLRRQGNGPLGASCLWKIEGVDN